MAPEVLSSKPFNCKADVYSFAITIWQMAAREKPWLNVPVWDIPARVIHGKRPQIPSTVPKDYAEVIRKCWCQKPDERPDFSEALELLKPIAKKVKKETRKEGRGKHRQYMSGISDNTVEFAMNLDESARSQSKTQSSTSGDSKK